jgi:hypothetical protein
VQDPTAARAGLGHRVDHALARQVLGQRPARRLAPREGLHGLGRRLIDLRRRFGLGLVLLQLEQLQLELVEQRAALRRLAEPFVPQLGDLVLELLDQQRLVAHLGAMRLPLGQQHRLQRLDVVGERFSGWRGHIAISGTIPSRRNGDSTAESPCRTAPLHLPSPKRSSGFAQAGHPATCGRQLRCGRRQSIPSSR